MARRVLFDDDCNIAPKTEDGKEKMIELEKINEVELSRSGEKGGGDVGGSGACSCSLASIREENDELKKKLEKAEKWIIGHEVRIYEMGIQVYELMQDKRTLDDFNGGMLEVELDVAGLKDHVEGILRRVEDLEKK